MKKFLLACLFSSATRMAPLSQRLKIQGTYMSITKKVALTLCALFLSISGTASASIVGSSTHVLNIPDFTGSPSPAVDVLIVPTHGAIDVLTVNVAIDHSWIGDLVIMLSHGDITVVLMDRPGFPLGTNGSSANLSALHPISFSDTAGLPAAEAIGAACSSAQTVGVSAACITTAYLSQEALSAFASLDQQGVWTLTVWDMAANDRGMLRGWSIDNTISDTGTVPEPASASLMALALIAMGVARHRRQTQA